MMTCQDKDEEEMEHTNQQGGEEATSQELQVLIGGPTKLSLKGGPVNDLGRRSPWWGGRRAGARGGHLAPSKQLPL